MYECRDWVKNVCGVFGRMTLRYGNPWYLTDLKKNDEMDSQVLEK